MHTKQAKIYLYILSACLVIASTPLSIVAFLYVMWLTARLIRLPFGFIGKLILSFLLMTSVISCIAALAWLANIPLSIWWILDLFIAALILYIGIKRPAALPKIMPSRQEVLDKGDLAATIASVIMMIIVCVPLVQKPSVATLASLIMYGGDNSAHMLIINTDNANKGYTIGQGNRSNVNTRLASYPQGWHINIAFGQWLLESFPSTHSPVFKLASFYGASVLYFGIFVFLCIRLALFLYAQVRALRLWTTILITGIGLIAVNALFLSLFAYGFQTQLFALSLFLATALCIGLLYHEKNGHRRYLYLLLASAFAAGSTMAWLFLLPIILIILVSASVHTWRKVKTIPHGFIVAAALLSSCIVFQVIVQVAIPLPGLTDSAINQRGNIVPTNLPLILTSFLSVTLAILLIKNKWVRGMYGISALSLSFALALLWYQTHTIHEPRYYYYKASYTYLLAISIVIMALAGLLFETMRLRLAKKARILAVVIVLCLVGLGLWTTKPAVFDEFVNGSIRGISPQQAETVVALIANNPQNASHITAIGSCNRGDDIRTLLLADSFASHPTGAATAAMALELSYLDKKYLLQAIGDYLTAHPDFRLIIISSDLALSDELRYALGMRANLVDIIDLDSTFETEPYTQCPDRVRELTPAEIAQGIL